MTQVDEKQPEINWPKSYSYFDVIQALNHVKFSQSIKESERINRFKKAVSEKTGCHDTVKIPEAYVGIKYFEELIERISKVRTDMMMEIFSNTDKIILELKQFIASIAINKPELKKLIDEETTAVRTKMLSDSRTAETTILGMYNSSKENIPVYTSRFNKLKYGLECIIWGKEIDMSVFEEDGKEINDLGKKFQFLKSLVIGLSEREKAHLRELLRRLILNIVGVFMVRRTCVVFEGHSEVVRFGMYFKECKITRLKELVIFDKNPFMLPDGNEVLEDEHKEIYTRMKHEMGYDERIDRVFNRFVIKVE